MGLLKLFGKSALDSFKKSIDEIQQSLAEIDGDVIEARFLELNDEFNKKFEKLKEQFKMVGNKFVVEVPYDRDTQTLSYKMEDGIITVIVETNEETESGSFKSKSTTARTIPESVNVNEMKHKYLADEKKMLFIFKGVKAEEPQEEVTENAAPTEETPCAKEVQPSKEELLQKMIHMHMNGCSYRKIGQECGVSDKTAKRWIGEYLAELDENQTED